MNSHRDTYGNHSSEKGQLWAHDGGEITLRVLEFAGLPVPDSGLEVSPPSGGALTVWSDGRYEFAPPSRDDSASAKESVSTFYGYVAEDLYGEIVVGSFVLAWGEDSPDLGQNFQAWSLPELMDGAIEALLAADASDGEALLGHGTPDFPSPADETAFAVLGPALDDLERLILDSQNT